MSKIKWLWSVAIAMGIVLIYASLSAYFVKIDEWYLSLTLPKFAFSPLIMTIGWSIVYIINIAVLARTVYFKYYLYVMIPLVILGIGNIIWCMTFFAFHALTASFIILIIQTALTSVIFIMLIKEDCISMIFWQVSAVWYLYLCVICWEVMTLN